MATILVSKSTKAIRGFQFPSTAVIESLVLHADGYETIAYGSQIWVGIDGGMTYRHLFTLPAGEKVRQLSSSPMQWFGFFTNHRQLYYGRTGIYHTVRLKSPIAKYHYPILVWRAKARLTVADVMTTPLSIQNVVEPPLLASKVLDDWSFECDLIPSGHSGIIEVTCGRCTSCFNKTHEGRAIKSIAGGMVHIQTVRDGVAVGYAAPSLKSDVKFSSCALPAAKPELNIFHSSDAACAVEILSNSCEDVRWNFLDEGKSILTPEFSLLIERVINSSHAYVSLHFISDIHCLDARVSMWGVYDFRKYTEYRLSVTTSMLLQPLTAARYRVTFQASTLYKHDKGKVIAFQLNETDNWGTIAVVTDSTHAEMIVTNMFDAFNIVETYSWTLFEAHEMYSGDSLIRIKKKRPWKLGVPECPYSQFGSQSSTLDVPVRYIDRRQSVRLFHVICCEP
jgi:hypothetical protein